MRTITAREFNHHMGRVLESIKETGEPVVITRRGSPGWTVISGAVEQDDPIEQLIREGKATGPSFEGELPDQPHPIPSGRTVEELIADVNSDHKPTLASL
jgi:PHD/YefM family antitoxin component YafN of YafNO toxin-antitoxin module